MFPLFILLGNLGLLMTSCIGFLGKKNLFRFCLKNQLKNILCGIKIVVFIIVTHIFIKGFYVLATHIFIQPKWLM